LEKVAAVLRGFAGEAGIAPRTAEGGAKTADIQGPFYNFLQIFALA
jgi:hypothetical protein